jgi:hypothetical protein
MFIVMIMFVLFTIQCVDAVVRLNQLRRELDALPKTDVGGYTLNEDV